MNAVGKTAIALGVGATIGLGAGTVVRNELAKAEVGKFRSNVGDGDFYTPLAVERASSSANMGLQLGGMTLALGGVGFHMFVKGTNPAMALLGGAAITGAGIGMVALGNGGSVGSWKISEGKLDAPVRALSID